METSAIFPSDEGVNIEPTEAPELHYDTRSAQFWQQYFIQNFIQKPGQHLLEIGRTGTGKTQFLYWVLDLMLHYGRDIPLWFDIGKGNEILALLEYFSDIRPVKIFTLTGCNLEITTLKKYDYSFDQVDFPRMIWDKIDPNCINVASFEPFILDPVIYINEISEMFKDLIYRAYRRRIPKPLCLVYDEFHNVAPAAGHGFAGTGNAARQQTASVNLIKRNIEKLRTEKIRFICTSHGWTKISKGVRGSFEWIVPRRGASFAGDEERLMAFNPRWQSMETHTAYLCIPTRHYGGPLRLPYYPVNDYDHQGKYIECGDVQYEGIYE